MASNATLPANLCIISNLNDAINKTKVLGINVTTLVSKCPDACNVVYANTQPDISGIGVNISYLTFVGLAVFFSLLRIFSLWSNNKLAEYIERRKDVFRTFADMASVFTIPVGIAFVIPTMKDNLSLYDSIYAGSLCFILWSNSLLAISLSLFSGTLKDITLKVVVTHFLYFWGISAPLLIILHNSASNRDFSAEVHQFGSSCKSYKDVGMDVSSTQMVGMIFVALCILSGLATMGFFIVGLVTQLWQDRFREKLKPAKAIFKMAFTLILIVFSAFSIGITVDFQHKRNIIKRIAGSDYQGDQWAFGQLIALFVWTPLLPVLWDDTSRQQALP